MGGEAAEEGGGMGDVFEDFEEGDQVVGVGGGSKAGGRAVGGLLGLGLGV